MREVLRAYCANYAELPENLAAIVFGNVIGHILCWQEADRQALRGGFTEDFGAVCLYEHGRKQRFSGTDQRVGSSILSAAFCRGGVRTAVYDDGAAGHLHTDWECCCLWKSG